MTGHQYSYHCTLNFIVFPILIVLIVRTSYCSFGHSFCLHSLIVPSVDTLLLPMYYNAPIVSVCYAQVERSARLER